MALSGVIKTIILSSSVAMRDWGSLGRVRRLSEPMDSRSLRRVTGTIVLRSADVIEIVTKAYFCSITLI